MSVALIILGLSFMKLSTLPLFLRKLTLETYKGDSTIRGFETIENARVDTQKNGTLMKFDNY